MNPVFSGKSLRISGRLHPTSLAIESGALVCLVGVAVIMYSPRG